MTGYDVFVKVPGTPGYHLGGIARSAADALALQNCAREFNRGISVRILPKLISAAALEVSLCGT